MVCQEIKFPDYSIDDGELAWCNRAGCPIIALTMARVAPAPKPPQGGRRKPIYFLRRCFMEVQTNKRVRINLSETAKGLWQIDCTAEFENVAESEKQLDAAVKAAKRVMAANNLKEVGE
jgi:hypothetical protein